MNMHCCINPSEILKPDNFQKVYLVEFEHRGFWSKRLVAYSTKDAKEIILKEIPDCKYNRCKISK